MSVPTTPRRLENYLLTCSALGAVAFPAAGKAGAAVVYSGIVNYPISPESVSGGLYIDFEDPANWSDGARVTGWDANPYFTGTSLYVAPNTQFVGTAAAVTNLPLNSLIGEMSAFETVAVSAPVGIAPGQTGYIGFRFDPDTVAGAQTWYGWMRYTVGPDLNTAGAVVEWAYENTGAPILAGVPEPSSLALLAMGAAGLVRRRRVV